MKKYILFIFILPLVISCQVKPENDHLEIVNDSLYKGYMDKYHELFLYGTKKEYSELNFDEATQIVSKMTQEEICTLLPNLGLKKFRGIEKHFQLTCEVYNIRLMLIQKYGEDFENHQQELIQEYFKLKTNNKN